MSSRVFKLLELHEEWNLAASEINLDTLRDLCYAPSRFDLYLSERLLGQYSNSDDDLLELQGIILWY